MQVSLEARRGRVSVAALMVAVVALSGASAFADGGGSDPLPKPAGGSAVYSEVYAAVGQVFHATSLLMELVY